MSPALVPPHVVLTTFCLPVVVPTIVTCWATLITAPLGHWLAEPSTRQVGPQPSIAAVLESSHCSSPETTPSPQTAPPPVVEGAPPPPVVEGAPPPLVDPVDELIDEPPVEPVDDLEETLLVTAALKPPPIPVDAKAPPAPSPGSPKRGLSRLHAVAQIPSETRRKARMIEVYGTLSKQATVPRNQAEAASVMCARRRQGGFCPNRTCSASARRALVERRARSDACDEL